MDVTADNPPTPSGDKTPSQQQPARQNGESVDEQTANVAPPSEAETEILSDNQDGLKKTATRKTIKLEADADVKPTDEDGDKSPGNGSLKRKRGDAAQDEQDSSRLSSPDIERASSEDSDQSESSAPAIETKKMNGRKRRETRSATEFDDSTNRSTSPNSHKPQRAQSSQSAGKNRRKTPAPLQVDRRNARPSEDAHESDSSSIRSHMRDPPPKSADLGMGVWKANKLTSKKNKDRSGRTLLARACAVSLEETEKWLEERSEDIDVADYAGNTPLQIASLNGHADIVKLLIDHKCKTDCKNVDNDTPLIDAVENGHLDVVELLLNAGVDPTQRNALGKEPIELIDGEMEEAEGMRSALEKSKRRTKKLSLSEDARQTSTPRDIDNAPSPTHSTRSPPFDAANKRRTARSQHTNDALLWVSPTPQRLRDAAGKGDMTIVDHILRMRPKADPEVVLAAAQGGHDEVLGMILAIAQPEADPLPLKNGDLRPGHSTPMLAAIGRGNTKIVKLLLDQPGFDPTRRAYKNLTYYEIAKERRGSNWQEEHDVLKEAYEQYKKYGGKKSSQSTPHRIRVRREEAEEKVHKAESEEKRVRSVSPSKPKRRLISGNDFKTDRESRRKALAMESLQRKKSGESEPERRRRLSTAASESPGRDESKKRIRASSGEVDKKKRLRVEQSAPVAFMGGASKEDVQAQIQKEEALAREKEAARLEEERRAQEEAAAARRRREEEMQKRRLEQEKQRREEQERRRREAEEREALRLLKVQQEEERLRREALPNGLRRYVELNPEEAKQTRELNRWLPLRTVTTKDFDRECHELVAGERWIANVQAAPLLANKDLELSQYTAWSRRPADNNHYSALWRQLRNPMSQATPFAVISPLDAFHLDAATRPKFFALKIFWIKLSDFMDTVSRQPHLNSVKLVPRDFVLDWPVKEETIKEEATASPPAVNGINGMVNGHV